MSEERKTRIRVVCLIATDSQNRTFIARRSEGRNLGGYWEFPGGKIQDDEPPEGALVREIREELGIDIEVGERLPPSVYSYDFGEVELIPFYGKLRTVPVASTDHDKLLWVKIRDLARFKLAPADIPIAEILRSHERKNSS